MRKHINSLHKLKELQNLPFYCWECITIEYTKNKDLDLVIRNEKDMMDLIQFLIYTLRTIDGKKNSLDKLLMFYNGYQPKIHLPGFRFKESIQKVASAFSKDIGKSERKYLASRKDRKLLYNIC